MRKNELIFRDKFTYIGQFHLIPSPYKCLKYLLPLGLPGRVSLLALGLLDLPFHASGISMYMLVCRVSLRASWFPDIASCTFLFRISLRSPWCSRYMYRFLHLGSGFHFVHHCNPGIASLSFVFRETLCAFCFVRSCFCSVLLNSFWFSGNRFVHFCIPGRASFTLLFRETLHISYCTGYSFVHLGFDSCTFLELGVHFGILVIIVTFLGTWWYVKGSSWYDYFANLNLSLCAYRHSRYSYVQVRVLGMVLCILVYQV